jgi:hypothetical protein
MRECGKWLTISHPYSLTHSLFILIYTQSLSLSCCPLLRAASRRLLVECSACLLRLVCPPVSWMRVWHRCSPASKESPPHSLSHSLPPPPRVKGRYYSPHWVWIACKCVSWCSNLGESSVWMCLTLLRRDSCRRKRRPASSASTPKPGREMVVRVVREASLRAGVSE